MTDYKHIRTAIENEKDLLQMMQRMSEKDFRYVATRVSLVSRHASTST